MVNYQGARVKLTNTQLNKLKSAAKNKTGTIARLNNRNFEDEEIQHELFLTTRQTAKIRKVFANNMSTNIKLKKAQISKTIQSDRFFAKTLGKPDKKVLLDLAVPLAKYVLAKSPTKVTSSVLDKFEKK